MCCLTVIVSRGPTSGWNLWSQIRGLAGLSIHKFLMRSLKLLDIKSQRGSCDDGGGWESINLQDVFLSVMITLLVPSFRKGLSNYSESASYQGKDASVSLVHLIVCVCVCMCLWWLIHSQELLSELSTAVQEGDPLRLSGLSPDTHVSPQLHCRCVVSMCSKGKQGRRITTVTGTLHTINSHLWCSSKRNDKNKTWHYDLLFCHKCITENLLC